MGHLIFHQEDESTAEDLRDHSSEPYDNSTVFPGQDVVSNQNVYRDEIRVYIH